MRYIGMNLKIIKSEKTLYGVLTLFSLVISALLFMLFFSGRLPYHFKKVEEIGNYGVDSLCYLQFVDFDGDNYSESIRYMYNDSDKNYHFHLNNSEGETLAQFNFWNNKIESWYLNFHDLDGDNKKEIVMINPESDSLFLNIISFKDREYILRRFFLTSRKYLNKREKWDIKRLFSEIYDFNGDGYNDILLGLGAGHSLNPRGLMILDYRNKTILDSLWLESNPALSENAISDLNGDGSPEIILHTAASDNQPDSTGFHDHSAWFLIFSSKFDTLYAGQYGGNGAEIEYYIDDNEGEKEIYLLKYDTKRDLVVSGFYKYSSGMELLNSREMNNKKRGKFNFFDYEPEPQIIDQDDEGFIKLYDSRFVLVDSLLNMYREMRFQPQHSFIYKNQKFKIFRRGDDLFLTDTRLKIMAQLTMGVPEPGITIRKRGKNGNDEIALSNAGDTKIYEMVESLFVWNSFLVYFLLNLIIFSIVILLHLSAKKLTTILRSMLLLIRESSSALFVLNSDGKLINYNQQFAGLINKNGIKKGEHFKVLLKELYEIESLVEESISSGDKIQKELGFFLDKKSFRGKIEIIPYKAFLGYVIAYMIRITDLTEDIINERLKVWSHTARKLAHEIKTPLGSINLNIRALSRRLEKRGIKIDEELADDINVIENEVGRIKNITSSLLKITNLERTVQYKHSLKEILHSSIEKFSAYINEGVEIYVSPTITDEGIFFDRSQLIEVIQIIIENAIDALGGQGEIELNSSPVKEKGVEYILLAVTDYGNGIKKEHLNSVFDPYFSTKKEGTGLGLAFAKKIIEDNNGLIKIESEYGKQTTVKIFLPRGKSNKKSNNGVKG